MTFSAWHERIGRRLVEWLIINSVYMQRPVNLAASALDLHVKTSNIHDHIVADFYGMRRICQPELEKHPKS